MPIGLELLLVLIAMACAVFELAGKVPHGLAALLLSVAALLRIAGH